MLQLGETVSFYFFFSTRSRSLAAISKKKKKKKTSLAGPWPPSFPLNLNLNLHLNSETKQNRFTDALPGRPRRLLDLPGLLLGRDQGRVRVAARGRVGKRRRRRRSRVERLFSIFRSIFFFSFFTAVVLFPPTHRALFPSRSKNSHCSSRRCKTSG